MPLSQRLRLPLFVWIACLATPLVGACATTPRSSSPTVDWQSTSTVAPDSREVHTHAVGTVPTSPERLRDAVRTLLHPRHAVDGETREVLVDTDDEMVVRTTLDAPFFMADRVVTLRYVFEDLDDGVRVTWRDITDDDDMSHGDAGTIAMARAEGSWTFRSTTSDVTQATYEHIFDLGGDIPGWLLQEADPQDFIAHLDRVVDTALAH